MRIAGLDVDECPKFLAKNPTESNHSIFFPDEDIRIPLLIEGIISYIPTRKPSLEEYNERAGDYLLLTLNLPDWNSHSDVYKDQEYGMLDYNGNIKQGKQESVNKRIQIMEVSSERSNDELTYDITHFINKFSAMSDIVSATLTARKGKTTAEY